jgi:hypothetical protein
VAHLLSLLFPTTESDRTECIYSHTTVRDLERTHYIFFDAFLDYCYYYGASKAEQKTRYGKDFGSLNLKQGHSRFTAYVAHHRNNATLVPRVWSEYLGYGSKDGLAPNAPWKTVRFNGSEVLIPIDEAKWVSTNAAALYGVAGIENLALVGAPDVSTIGGNGTSSRRM